MFEISVNQKTCIKCQKCAQVCTIDVIKAEKGNIPTISFIENCFCCGHCVAVCPQKALIHSEFNYENLIDRNDCLLSKENVANFLVTKRSCRFYKSNKITPIIWEKLTRAVSFAPTAFNCEDRAITVISNQKILLSIGKDIIKKAKKILKLFQMFQKRPFKCMFHESSIKHFKRLCLDFKVTIDKYEAGKDGLFHNAPYLVIISSVGMDPLGKDHSLAACHYMMFQAEALGIGSAINGFAQSFPKIIAKHVKLPHMHKAFAVITMGYPSLTFQRSVERKKVEVNVVQ